MKNSDNRNKNTMSLKLIVFVLFCLLFILTVSVLIFMKSDSHSPHNHEQTENLTTQEANNYPTVIIDAGHGGEDGGAIGINGVYEKDLNLKIALELNELLKAAGIQTRLTRSEDTLLYDKNSDYEGRKKVLDMAARLGIAQEYDNAIFISIHMNSFPQEQYSGLQVYYSENSPLSTDLAKTVQEIAVKNLQPDNTRKIKSAGDNIYLLDKITHPAILIECGFLSNNTECHKLCTDEYRHRLCMTIYYAIMNYFDTLSNNPSNNP